MYYYGVMKLFGFSSTFSYSGLKHYRVCFSSFTRYFSRTSMDLNTLFTSTGPASQLFATDSNSKNYAQFRPNYNSDIYEIIHEFCKETRASLELAVDVGCGSGQSSVPLTKYIPKVIGLDVSESQIAQAPSHIPGLSFRCTQAEDLSCIENGTADVVTVAQAFHWFDKEKFCQEADRVLKPGGALVVYGYGNCYVENAEAQAHIQQIYYDVLGKYWNEGRKWIETKYASVTLPYQGWRRDDSLVMEKIWTVNQVFGYICSWSAWNKFLSENPESTLINDMRSELMRLYGTSDQSADSNVEVKISWPVFILMGHKPL